MLDHHPTSGNEVQKLKTLILEAPDARFYDRETIATIARRFGGLQYLQFISQASLSLILDFRGGLINPTTLQLEAGFKHDFQEAWVKERLMENLTTA